MSQTSYSVYMAAAFEGGHGELTRVIAGRNNTGADIKFGRFVVFDGGAGTSDLAVKLPSATTDVVRGATLFDQSHELAPAGAAGSNGIPDDAVCNLVAQGQIWVPCETAMNPGSPVFVRCITAGATGTSPELGKVRNDADTAKAIGPIAARVIQGAAAGGLALIEVNLP